MNTFEQNLKELFLSSLKTENAKNIKNLVKLIKQWYELTKLDFPSWMRYKDKISHDELENIILDELSFQILEFLRETKSSFHKTFIFDKYRNIDKTWIIECLSYLKRKDLIIQIHGDNYQYKISIEERKQKIVTEIKELTLTEEQLTQLEEILCI